MSVQELRDRFRGICADRIHEICQALERPGAASEPAALRDALGELHTIKGESAMVGFSTISELAHSLEDWIAKGTAAGSVPVADILAALRVLDEALRQPPDALLQDPELNDLLAEVREAVQCAPEASPTAAGTQQSSPAKTQEVAAMNAAQEEAVAISRAALRWTRVDAAQIGALSEGIAEASQQLGRIRTQLAGVIGSAPAREIVRQLHPILQDAEAACAALDGLTARTWALRLVPVAPALEDLMAHARALASSIGKEVHTEVVAAGVELERNLLDALHEPLMHIVRNAIDHGIELPEARKTKPRAARLRLNAEAQGSDVVVSVEDDGMGLDPERIRDRALALRLVEPARALAMSPAEILDLIFLAGFTQRDSADSLSGRGMGLHAARRKVEGLGGSLRVQSAPGNGARFVLTIASQMSKERVLRIRTGGAQYGIPSRWVRAVVRDPQALVEAQRRRVFRHQEEMLAVRSLADWLDVHDAQPSALLVVDIADQRAAVLVSSVVGELDLLRRPADSLLAASGRVVASGLAEDGSAVLILRWADVLRDRVHGAEGVQARPTEKPRGRVLVVDDSPVVRDIVSDILVHAGLSVETVSDGMAALERLRDSGIDLVISDVEMPRMDGFELLANIRRRTEALPVIMLTTRSSPEDRRKAASLGANAYVIKSEFQGSTLLEVVRRYVELPQ